MIYRIALNNCQKILNQVQNDRKYFFVLIALKTYIFQGEMNLV